LVESDILTDDEELTDDTTTTEAAPVPTEPVQH